MTQDYRRRDDSVMAGVDIITVGDGDLVTDFDQATRGMAVFAPDRVYRYGLSRVWDPETPPVTWIMLNPSTADAFRNDATIRRCIGYTTAWGWGGIRVLNLFALRASDPRELARHPDPVGPANDPVIRQALQADAEGPVVAAWGSRGGYHGRDAVVLGLLSWLGIKPWCLGPQGQPAHPLYLPADRTPHRYTPRKGN